jgi:hypothetical protein
VAPRRVTSEPCVLALTSRSKDQFMSLRGAKRKFSLKIEAKLQKNLGCLAASWSTMAKLPRCPVTIYASVALECTSTVTNIYLLLLSQSSLYSLFHGNEMNIEQISTECRSNLYLMSHPLAK